MKTIAFFTNKGEVENTSLVYHLAWMFADKGVKVLAADLDPQANLTAIFLNEDRLEDLWPDDDHPETVFGAIRPLLWGTGDIADPHVEEITPNLRLLAGDLGLSNFEDKLSDAWPRCLDGDEAAFRITTAFYRLMQKAMEWGAELALIDVGPNLGVINRSALVASNSVCLPLAPDLFSLQGLKNLGPTLRRWRSQWIERLLKAPTDLSKPQGTMSPIGYIVMQHSIRDSRPVKAYQRWMNRIPDVYRKSVLDQEPLGTVFRAITDDENCLSLLKHYRSLMVMAMEARKPVFFLKPADGAIGSHVEAVNSCYQDFAALAGRIAKSVGVEFPASSF